MGKDLRRSSRVDFDGGMDAQIMGIDGTWRRPCKMIDVSEGGALIAIEGGIAGLDLKEFFLLLSSIGLAYRRCQLVRVSGDQVGVRFIKPAPGKKKGAVWSPRLQPA
jgi:hypothetical protein